jgi:hypothetical protein
MRRARRSSYLLRDTRVSIAFWLVVAVGILLVGDSIVRGNLMLLATTASIVALALWVFGMVLYRPHVRYDESRVVVTNIGRIHEIPWSRVVAVRQNITLSFELDDGRRLSATGVTAPRDRGLVLASLTRGKMGAGSTAFHSYADALRLLHEGAATSDAPVVSRWDVPALAIGAVLALALVASVVIGTVVP